MAAISARNPVDTCATTTAETLGMCMITSCVLAHSQRALFNMHMHLVRSWTAAGMAQKTSLVKHVINLFWKGV